MTTSITEPLFATRVVLFSVAGSQTAHPFTARRRSSATSQSPQGNTVSFAGKVTIFGYLKPLLASKVAQKVPGLH